MQLNTGAKVWLWIIFVMGIIGCAVSAVGLLGILAVFGPIIFVASIVDMAVLIVRVVGIAMILFSSKKSGFYIMCACSAISLVLSIIAHANIVLAIISAVVSPLITYLLLKSQWEELA